MRGTSDLLSAFGGMAMCKDFLEPLGKPRPLRSAGDRRGSFARRAMLVCQLAALVWVFGNHAAGAQDLTNEALATEQIATVDSERFQFVPSKIVIASSLGARKDSVDASRPKGIPDALAGGPLTGVSGTILALAMISLLGSLALIATIPLAAPVAVSAKPGRGGSQGRQGGAKRTARNFEEECRAKLTQVPNYWRDAEASVLQLDVNHPLRTLLEKELSSIGWRLSMYPRLDPVKSGALTNGYTLDYWRVMHREVSQALRELRRVNATAEAGRDSVGTQTSLPQMPNSVEDAYFVLGVNSEVTDDTLKRLVRALRQCWHPDLAQNTAERDYREARIRQINVANDLISKQWQESGQTAG